MALSDYDDLFEQAGKQYNVDPRLLRAIGSTESSGDPAAVSSAGAQGLMQFTPETAKAYGIDPLDPKQAIPAAAKYLSQALDKYGNPEDALKSYAGGPNQAIWGPNTQGYPAAVARRYAELGQTMQSPTPQQAAPQEDAFSAAFSTPKAADAPASTNDAFSAAFGAAPKSDASPTTPETPNASTHASGLMGLAADALAGNLKGSPALQAIAPIANAAKQFGGDISDAIRNRSAELSNDFTSPLDPSRVIAGHDVSDIIPQSPMLDRAAKIVGDVGNVAASPIEGAATYLLGRPLATASAIANAHGIGNRLTPQQIGEDASTVAQVAAGRPAPSGEAPALATAEPSPGNRLAIAAPRPDPWTGKVTPAEEALPPQPQNALAPWGAQPNNALVPPNAAGMSIPDKLPPKPLLPVLTQAGADKQAQRIIDHFAGPAPLNIDTSEIVPGSTPTLAHATGNPGIATLERGFMDANPGPFADRTNANDAARTQLLQNTIGTPQDIEAAEAARESQTSALRDAAFAPGNVDRADARPVVDKINEILASPSGQRDAVQSSLNNILSKLQIKDPETGAVTLQTDPQQLYGIRKAIGDALSPLSAGTAADGRQAARELGQVQDTLDTAIESGAPGFGKYIDAYSAASRPIDGMKYLQGLNLTDPKGNVTLAKIDNAIKTINKGQNAGGAKPVKSVSDDQLANLTAVRDDLRRQANIYQGKSLGSTTFQNLATNAATGALGNPIVAHGATLLGGLHPALGIPLAGARYGANRLAGRGEAMVQQALQNRLLNAASALNARTSTPQP